MSARQQRFGGNRHVAHDLVLFGQFRHRTPADRNCQGIGPAGPDLRPFGIARDGEALPLAHLRLIQLGTRRIVEFDPGIGHFRREHDLRIRIDRRGGGRIRSRAGFCRRDLRFFLKRCRAEAGREIGAIESEAADQQQDRCERAQPCELARRDARRIAGFELGGCRPALRLVLRQFGAHLIEDRPLVQIEHAGVAARKSYRIGSRRQIAVIARLDIFEMALGNTRFGGDLRHVEPARLARSAQLRACGIRRSRTGRFRRKFAVILSVAVRSGESFVLHFVPDRRCDLVPHTKAARRPASQAQ